VKWAGLVLRLLLFAVCGVGGYFIAGQIKSLEEHHWTPWVGVVVGILSAWISTSVIRIFTRVPIKVLTGGTIGLVAGLLIAKMVGFGFSGLENQTVRITIFIILTCIFGYIGMVLGSIKVEELRFPNLGWFGKGSGRGGPSKILDTSVIIDGRVADIVEAGFLEGTLVVPEFVLQELQRIADSPDQTRRVRGRRGLDVLKRLQQDNLTEVRIERQQFNNIAEVDAKLVALALRLNGQIVTNDYNLAQVAEVQGLQVLSINKLANALKPVVLPGEILRLQILKEGKEQGQGIGYLEDGTMVVVENASKLLGKEVDAAVTSVLQTTAGRLIFTTIKDGDHGRRH
jgi:uncharacterized protein YacL